MAKTFSQHKDTPKYITELARKNRLNPTSQERLLWDRLSGCKICGHKFRRQFPIGRYIVDFYNHENRFVIEVDGGIHDSVVEYDRNREKYLSARGFLVLHFKNTEIESNLESVLQRIADLLKVPLRGI
jgi:very-short-patch-repair endonuclease